MDYPSDLDIDLYSCKPILRREYAEKNRLFMQSLDNSHIP